MADALRLSQNPLPFSSSRLPLVFQPSLGILTQLSIFPKQQKLDKIGSFSPAEAASSLLFYQRKRLSSFTVCAAVAEKNDEPKWWEKNAGPNMVDIHSTEDFLNALSRAGDQLVIVEFYGTWCGSCRALFPKLCRTAEEHPDILFLKVNFDENKPMCKSLNVKVLPYFHFYRGADGQLESFSCSLAKFQKIKDAIEKHSTARCSIGPPMGVGELNLPGASNPTDKPAEASSR